MHDNLEGTDAYRGQYSTPLFATKVKEIAEKHVHEGSDKVNHPAGARLDQVVYICITLSAVLQLRHEMLDSFYI